MRDVCVLGLGYIGLPTASLLAARGLKVLGVDIDPGVVARINSGGVHIAEPGLETVVSAATKSGNLQAALAPEPARTYIICVPTPFRRGHRADLRAVEAAARAITPHLANDALVIVESTVPPGTTRDVVLPILQRGRRGPKPLHVAHCPERVLPGRILEELVSNARVVGGVTHEAAERAASVYRTFVTGQVYLTDDVTAETVKLVENSYRDVNIGFANELSRVCDALGVNVWEVIRLAGQHPRVKILSPGPGVGGHCIAVDPWFLIEKAPRHTPLLRAARQVNDGMPAHIVDRLERGLARHRIRRARIACLGVTYKADVADIRESPALAVIRRLMRRHTVRVHDPFVTDVPGLPFLPLEKAVAGVDCLVVLVDHGVYRRTPLARLVRRMRRPFLLDTRGIYLDQLRASGAVAL